MNTSLSIELRFPVRGHTPIPADHGYALLGAVTQWVPAVHGGNGFALAPIAGRNIGARQMAFTRSSRVTVRTDMDRVPEFLPLAGKQLKIAGRKLILGAPTIEPLTPSPTLRARLVTIKGFFEPGPFVEAVKRQLEQLDVEAIVEPGRQRTIRIKCQEILGFETTLSQLSDDASVKILSQGIGGRRHMGCGVFVPMQEGNDGKRN